MDGVAFEVDVAPVRPAFDAPPAELDPLPGVIEPWLLLGSQWTAGMARASGERRLLAAVLADAIRQYLKYAKSPTVSGRLLFRDTAEWVESRDRGWLVSYESVCDVLGIDSGQLRRRLRALATAGECPALPYDAGRLRTGKGRKVRV